MTHNKTHELSDRFGLVKMTWECVVIMWPFFTKLACQDCPLIAMTWQDRTDLPGLPSHCNDLTRQDWLARIALSLQWPDNTELTCQDCPLIAMTWQDRIDLPGLPSHCNDLTRQDWIARISLSLQWPEKTGLTCQGCPLIVMTWQDRIDLTGCPVIAMIWQDRIDLPGLPSHCNDLTRQFKTANFIQWWIKYEEHTFVYFNNVVV